MKQSSFDAWLTNDPNGNPAPLIVTASNRDGFADLDLACDYCGIVIGWVWEGEEEDDTDELKYVHHDFVYQDVGGEPGEVFCCQDCLPSIRELRHLVAYFKERVAS